MKTKKIAIAVMASILIFAGIGVFVALHLKTPVSAAEYVKYTAEQRLENAAARYGELKKNPSKKTEVLISFKNVTLDELTDILPENAEIVRVFHYYTYNGKTVTGAYAACEGKNLAEIQSSYYCEIHGMIESNIAALEEEKQAVYEQYMLDFSIAPEDFNPEDMLPEWEYDGETVEEIEERIAYNRKHLEDMENGKFDLRGIRIKAVNSDIEKLIESDKVFMVEILDFDNNDIIVPVIFN